LCYILDMNTKVMLRYHGKYKQQNSLDLTYLKWVREETSMQMVKWEIQYSMVRYYSY